MAINRAKGRRGRIARGGFPPEAVGPSRARRAARIAVLITLVTMGLLGISTAMRGSVEPAAPGPEQRGTLRAQPATSDLPALDRSTPARLDLPSVGIHTRLLELGLNPDGTLEVPSRPLLAGWYSGSPTPGQLGPSVIAGHVDSKDGPAVFYRLGQVKPGDSVKVTLTDHKIANFTVTAVRSYSKSDFPTLTVYGNTDRAALRLITCADWDPKTKHYVGNLVVFAELDQPGSRRF